MFQPDALKSEEYQQWSRGRGTEVWAMLCAARDGDLETVKKLAAHDPKLIDCEFEYRKPLDFAVRENQCAVVEFLLEHGADPTEKIGRDSPVQVARERGHREVDGLLTSWLEARYHVVPEGESIAALIRTRDLPRLRSRLDAQPELVHAADERGNQPIHWAAMTRQLELIDLLLERGANINARRPDGARPLDLTHGDYWYRGWRDVPEQALCPHTVVLGYLLARGADYDISTAAKIGDVERVRALLDENPELVSAVPPYSNYYSGLPLGCAAGAGHAEVVRLLLERGADPNAAEKTAPQGHALRSAIGSEHVEIVKLLLEHGANPNAAVESSGNCLWAAQGNQEIFDLVASHGGIITFELACYDGNKRIVEDFLNANPEHPVTEESLHYIAENGHQELMEMILRRRPEALRGIRLGDPNTPEFARWLLERGADPNRPNWLGIRPLHRFALRGKVDLAEVCVEFGAEIDPVDDEYCSSPLGWAARGGQKEMVEWLLARGAKRDCPRDKPWAQPRAWAVRRGHTEIADMLQP